MWRSATAGAVLTAALLFFHYDADLSRDSLFFVGANQSL